MFASRALSRRGDNGLGHARVVPFVTEVLPNYRGYKLRVFEPLDDFPSDSDANDARRMNAFLEAQILLCRVKNLAVFRRLQTRGTTVPGDRKDLSDKKFDLQTCALLMNPQTAVRLAMFFGTDSFGALGGTFFGIAVITSEDIPAGFVGLIDGSRLEVVDEGVVPETSSQALLFAVVEGGETTPVNLWQQNAIALRVVHFHNWNLTEPQYARYIPDVFSNLTPATAAQRKGSLT